MFLIINWFICLKELTAEQKKKKKYAIRCVTSNLIFPSENGECVFLFIVKIEIT